MVKNGGAIPGVDLAGSAAEALPEVRGPDPHTRRGDTTYTGIGW